MDSILDAVLTVSPNRQYRGIFVPTTPATSGPEEHRTVNRTLRLGYRLNTSIFSDLYQSGSLLVSAAACWAYEGSWRCGRRPPGPGPYWRSLKREGSHSHGEHQTPPCLHKYITPLCSWLSFITSFIFPLGNCSVRPWTVLQSTTGSHIETNLSV